MNRQRQLPAFALQVLGIGLLIFSVAFWAITGRQSVPILSIGLTLTTLGSITRLLGQAQRELPPYDPPPLDPPPPGTGTRPPANDDEWQAP